MPDPLSQHSTAVVQRHNSNGSPVTDFHRSHEKFAEQPSTSSDTRASNDYESQLIAIHKELNLLQQRRDRLEEQRQRLLQNTAPSSSQWSSGFNASSRSNGQHRTAGRKVPSSSGLTSPPHASRSSSVTANSLAAVGHRSHIDPLVLSQERTILSEEERRREQQPTPFRTMKTAMREATQKDSTCLMGSFLLEDNPRVCTFGRERRFRSLVGQRGKYYLSNDVGLEQFYNHERGHGGRQIAAQLRHYDDTPGPGAYTPRYGKLSNPPRAFY